MAEPAAPPSVGSSRVGFNVTRRGLLTGVAAGGGLLAAWWVWPRQYDAPLDPGAGEQDFGAWLNISEDGVIAVAVPQLEMGQGVTTLLPQLIAQEMGADWRQMAVVPAPPSGAQPNTALAAKWAPLWSQVYSLAPSLTDKPDSWLAERFARAENFTVTADGMSQAAYEDAARHAAASARAMLAMAAGEAWGVPWEECVVSAGLVRHETREARFGELAAIAATMEPPDPPPLRPSPPFESPINAEEGASVPVPRLDLPAKVDGSLMFAGDIRLSGMVHASIRHGPVGLPELTAFDESAAARTPGLIQVVKSKRWIACVADSWWQAEQACEALKPRFDGPGAATSITIAERLDEGLASGEALPIAGRGEPAENDEPPTMTSSYNIGPAHHGTIETASVTAHYTEGKLHLWLASQAPEHARLAAAKAIGISVRDVVLYPVPAGGSFDARLEKQHAIEAAQIAEQVGRPVQLTWPRAEEMKMVPVRAPAAIQIAAKLSSGEDRKPLFWRTRIAAPPSGWEFGARLFGNATPEAAIAEASGRADPMVCEGAMPAYDIANASVGHIPVELALPTGRLRGNAAAVTHFASESFVDEIAHGLGQDPMLYRLTLLSGDARFASVLRRAAQLGEWDGGREGTGQGIAAVRMDDPFAPIDGDKSESEGAQNTAGGGRIACVAKVRLGEGGVIVTSLHAVVDIGRIVNLDLARQQIEGGLIFGLGLATGSTANWENGLPQPARMAGLNLPSLASAPEVVVEFAANEAPSFDAGELGAAVAAPAIANALFAANGERYRSLPLLTSSFVQEAAETEEELETGAGQDEGSTETSGGAGASDSPASTEAQTSSSGENVPAEPAEPS